MLYADWQNSKLYLRAMCGNVNYNKKKNETFKFNICILLHVYNSTFTNLKQINHYQIRKKQRLKNDSTTVKILYFT